MTEALVVLSTGRCGTQWLATMVQRICCDSAEVTHAPLGDDYAARQVLAAGDPARLDPGLVDPILAHIDATSRLCGDALHLLLHLQAWAGRRGDGRSR